MTEHYELLYIVPGTMTEDEVQPTIEAVHRLLTDRGATVTKTEFWGKRKLAFEIKHVRQGYYDLVEFDLDPAALADLEKALRLHDGVLRHAIVRKRVKTPERLAAEERLRERIAAYRQAEKEKETVAELAAATPAPAPAATTEAKVAPEKLEEKLEEMLESDTLEV